jgi:predicted transcriptional regulator
MTTVTLELDDDVVADLRSEAERTGRSVDRIASDRLRSRSDDHIFDRLRARDTAMDEDEAMQLALDEIRAMREERRQAL